MQIERIRVPLAFTQRPFYTSHRFYKLPKSSRSLKLSSSASETFKPTKPISITNEELKILINTSQKEEWNSSLPKHVTDLVSALDSDLRRGLNANSENLNVRRKLFGSNRFKPLPAVSFFDVLLDALDDFTLMILIASGALSLFLEYALKPGGEFGWLEGTAILFSVVVVLLVTSTTNFQKEIKFRELSALNEDVKVNPSSEAKESLSKQVRVIRDGKEQQISSFDLVVGDIMIVEGGDILQADGILVDGSMLRLDESHLTGECDERVRFYLNDPLVFSGSKVNEGFGRVLVLAVGIHSKQGSIASLASGQTSTEFEALQNPTSLQQTTVLTEKLNRLAADIGQFGLAASLITLFAMSVPFSYQTFVTEHQNWDWKFLEVYLHQIITSITILVVAIPEGLPLASTLALAFSVQRMMQDNNLVRNLEACETMGSVTTICTDKTGTLTSNDLNVQRIWIGDRPWSASDFNPSANLKRLLAETISMNTTATLKNELGKVERIGNRTECGLLKFVNGTLESDFATIRDSNTKVNVTPFTSARKRMSVLSVSKMENESDGRFHVKGAPEIILNLCTSKLDAKGTAMPFQSGERERLLSSFIEGDSALRVLAFAYKPVDISIIDSKILTTEALERDLIFIGMIGLSDSIRSEAPFAIRQCQRAGVDVKMLTGDNAEIAGMIAEACHILNGKRSPNAILEGPEFRSRVIDGNGQLNTSEFERIWKDLKVMARCSPEDKYLLVRGIQSIRQVTLLHLNSLFFRQHGRREVIAMTGDGTNDAPALKTADVGFAMASGTPIARDASDILLLDDSFQSIVSAMKWGRNVFASVTKFLQFQLTVNIVAMTTACTGAIWLQESPLSAVQMLWVNLIMDSLASLSLATESPTDDVLDLPPNLSDAPILSPEILKNIIGQSAYQLSVMGFLIFGGDLLSHDSIHRFTLVFNAFVCMQLTNQVNSRKIYNETNLFDGLFSNRLFLLIWASEAFLQFLIVQYGGEAFQTTPLDFRDWLICIGFGALSFPVREWIRIFNTRDT